MTLARRPSAKAFVKNVFIDQERKLEDRRRSDTAFKNRDDGSFSNDFGWDHGSHSLGDQGQTSKGSTKASFNNVDSGAKVGY